MNMEHKPETCPICGQDVIVECTNIYRLCRLPDGTIESRLEDTATSVSCSTCDCEDDLRTWLEDEIEKGNIHGITWLI